MTVWRMVCSMLYYGSCTTLLATPTVSATTTKYFNPNVYSKLHCMTMIDVTTLLSMGNIKLVDNSLMLHVLPPFELVIVGLPLWVHLAMSIGVIVFKYECKCSESLHSLMDRGVFVDLSQKNCTGQTL